MQQMLFLRNISIRIHINFYLLIVEITKNNIIYNDVIDKINIYLFLK